MGGFNGVSVEELISLADELRNERPHVVILGAGASLAAFPNGDANGKRIPLMKDLLETLDLSCLEIQDYQYLEKKKQTLKTGGFEELYSLLYSENPESSLVKRLEEAVKSYFIGLEYPAANTIYDFLVLSLRKKDAIFTFNWDPFLSDAMDRHQGEAELPLTYYLHGNVCYGYCHECDRAVCSINHCPECGNVVRPSSLLYPTSQKNYEADQLISEQWRCLRELLKDAEVVTIFGYSLPLSDAAAKDIFLSAWKWCDSDRKPYQRIEIVNIDNKESLTRQWRDFAHFPGRLSVVPSIEDSILSRYPRRTCEWLRLTGLEGRPVSPFEWTKRMDNLYEEFRPLIEAEQLRY